MISSLTIHIEAEAMRGFTGMQMFCPLKGCGGSILDCARAVEITVTDTSATARRIPFHSVVCASCAPGLLDKLQTKLPKHLTVDIFDGRKVDWSCPGLTEDDPHVLLTEATP